MIRTIALAGVIAFAGCGSTYDSPQTVTQSYECFINSEDDVYAYGLNQNIMQSTAPASILYVLAHGTKLQVISDHLADEREGYETTVGAIYRVKILQQVLGFRGTGHTCWFYSFGEPFEDYGSGD